jgi:hypothetical protein
MAPPRLTPDQIAQVSELVPQYISTQRDRYRSRATPLSAQQKAAMAGFFSPQLLESTDVLLLQGERVANPDFYPMLKSLGFKNLPDQSRMGAITFCDVVVSHEPFYDGLLFHELVHAEQYRQLGIPQFSELYVRGFLNGGSYEAIPLEVNAYTLEGRFEANHHQRFSVEDEVRKWHAER